MAIKKRSLARLFVLGLVVGTVGAQSQLFGRDKCPDCYRCPCSLGTNEYGFDDCIELPGGGCGPNGGNPCCLPDGESATVGRRRLERLVDGGGVLSPEPNASRGAHVCVAVSPWRGV